MKNLRVRDQLILFALLTVLFVCCEKKYLDIVPVLTIEKSISIPDGGSIKYFSFPNADVGYASADTAFYYKTIDGGNTWAQVNLDFGDHVRGLEFFTSTKGVCLIDGTIYSTSDGGDNWNSEISGIVGMGITDDGIAIACDEEIASVSVYQSLDSGQVWTLAGTVPKQVNASLTKVNVSGNIAFTSTDDDGLEGFVRGWDLSLNDDVIVYADGLTAYDEFSEVYKEGTRVCAVGNRGNIYLGNSSAMTRSHYGNMRQFNSVHGKGGLLVAVGESTISSNQVLEDSDETWNEVLNEDGSSFSATYYKIEFFDTRSFYLSGDNGLLLKCKLP